MRGEGVQPSRTPADLRRQDAATLTAAVSVGLGEAVRVTAGWDRRRLLDTALTLAVWHREELHHRPRHPATLDRLGPRYAPQEAAWSDTQLRQAHNAYGKGARDPRTVEGKRIYDRLRKRRSREAS